MKELSNQKLLRDTHKLIRLERKTLLEILEFLREIYNRRLYAEMGYSNLIKFMVKELGYSESAAYRRYSALKLTSAVPETKALIAEGKTTLSKVTQVETLLRGENKEIKKQVLMDVQNLSSREAEKVIIEKLPEDKQEALKARRSTDTVEIDDEIKSLINQLRVKLNMKNEKDIIKYSLNLTLKTKPRIHKSKGRSNPRYFCAAIKRQAMVSANGKCQFPNCDEKNHLEFDHIHPYALGGGNHQGNIRVLCKEHNLLLASKRFGQTQKIRRKL